MKLPHFTDEQIEAATPTEAEQMQLINEITFYLKAGRQFTHLAVATIVAGMIIVITSNGLRGLLYALAIYGLGLISNLIGFRYIKKANKLNERFKEYGL